MAANYTEIQELLQQRADIQARLNLMPYDGNPEMKEVSGTKYLYTRKRVAGKLTSTYVDVYSDELYQLLLRNAKERKDLNKRIRKINKELLARGYEEKELSSRVLENLDFTDIAIELCMYCMKTQVFKDGNKRASVIFANHYLIAHGNGFLVIPEMEIPEFKKLLVEYYEGAPLEIIGTFLRKKCWKNFLLCTNTEEKVMAGKRYSGCLICITESGG